MNRVLWTWEAVGALDKLAEKEEDRLYRLLELVESFPEMYPKRQHGRFAGLRYFLLGNRWLVYYRVQDDGNILVFTLVAARSGP